MKARGDAGVGMAVDLGSGEGITELGHVGIGTAGGCGSGGPLRPSLFPFCGCTPVICAN